MKKTISLILCAVMLCSLVALTGCVAPADAALKFGSAVYVGAPKAADATADKDGSGSIDITIAAVSVDADGKIVACALVTASNAVSFKAVPDQVRDGQGLQPGRLRWRCQGVVRAG